MESGGLAMVCSGGSINCRINCGGLAHVPFLACDKYGDLGGLQSGK